MPTVKDLIRPLPGVRSISLLRQRAAFAGSAQYWESRYADGGTSGDGSYGESARTKADFLNAFVYDHSVRSVVEFGCGDGHQLSLARYPLYIGLDVSRSAVKLCKSSFADDLTKSFFLYEGDCFVDRAHLFACDLALSLDVIYHLTEEHIFEAYMEHLFAAARRYVVVYSTDDEHGGTAAHVRHRNFSAWIGERFPQWHLSQVTCGPDFFVYEQHVA